MTTSAGMSPDDLLWYKMLRVVVLRVGSACTQGRHPVGALIEVLSLLNDDWMCPNAAVIDALQLIEVQ